MEVKNGLKVLERKEDVVDGFKGDLMLKSIFYWLQKDFNKNKAVGIDKYHHNSYDGANSPFAWETED